MLLSQRKNKTLSRLDLVVRKSFLDSIGTDEYEFYRGMYLKMQYNRTGYKVHTNKLPWVEQFLILDRSFYKKGYLSNYPLVMNENKHLINSSHRAALCLHHKIDEIPFMVSKQWKEHLEKTGSKTKTYFDYGTKWFSENGFSETELKIIQKKKIKLFEELNLFFYFIIWPPAEKFFDSIHKQIKKDYAVIACNKVEIKNLDRLIKDIYLIDNISDWKLQKKTQSILESTKSRKVMIMKVDLFQTDFRKKTNFPEVDVSLQAEKIKQVIRNEYKNKINNYFHDIIIHSSDNYEHVDHIRHILRENKIET